MANIESTTYMKRFLLLGLMISVLAGCEDMPLLGGEGEGDDFAATSRHQSVQLDQSQPQQKLPIKQ